MNCKLPIRTYGRKKYEVKEEGTNLLQKLHTPIINISKELSVTELTDNNNSTFCDPFDTTFDRLLKKTRDTKQSSDSDNIKALRRSDKVNSILCSNASVILGDNSLLFNDLKTADISIKYNLRKRLYREVQVKEHNICIRKVYRRKRNKLELELKSNDDNTTKVSDENINMKEEERNNSDEVIESSIDNLKYNNVVLKNCSVKLENLRTSLPAKPSHSNRKFENIVSSTPIGRPIRPTNIIALSPISVTYSEKLNELVRYTDNSLGNVSVSVNNINSVSSKNVQINTNMYDQSETNRESKNKLFVDEIDGPNSSKGDLNELETLQKNKRFSSIELDYGSTRSYKQDCMSNTLFSDVTNLHDTSVSIAYNNEVEDMLKKIEEKSCNVLPTITLQNTNISVDTEECNSKTEGLHIENSNNTRIPKEPKDLNRINNNLSARSTIIISDESSNAFDPCVLPLQLQDPIRITMKRKQYRKWETNLFNISENVSTRKTLESLENIPKTSIINISTKTEKPIYLKPGKSWTRSLSILNNIQNESNLEKLSIGKGRQWRQSVIDILNMQKDGIFHSCIKTTESDINVQARHEAISTSKHELINKKGRTSDSISFGRLTRRISVRVVPIHKTVKSIEDAPFLEVYGIVPIKSQRFTLLSNPRKSSVCNIENDDIDGHINDECVVSTAREVILGRCLQQDYIPFSTHFSDSYLNHCRKIGEGVYGEVFLYEHDDEKSVIKIIPIEGNEYVNGEPQKKFHEILSEIVIAMELHNLRFNANYNTDSFVEVKDIKCLKGKYPKKLVDLWIIYDEEKHSENDCPSMFNEDQLYIILELGHGGQDLEAFVFPSADQAHTSFIQAALALAVAEKAVEFEHRDLHWGNILISPTTESHVQYKLGEKQIKFVSKGVKVSIIDFTLSRVTYQGCSVFNDLASEPSLFTAQGEYQFEIYRLMRDKNKNNWQKFEPYTNILWLHYTLDKMITAVRYRKTNLKIHKNSITKLKKLKNEILSYNSAFDFISNCSNIKNLLFTVSESELASS